MYNFFRGMTIVAIVFALSGCSVGELSLGNLSPSVKDEYEISGSSFDKAFQMAYRALEESDFEIYNSDKDAGTIDVLINKDTDPFQDVRVITTKPPEFEFNLKETKSGKLVFNIESKSSSQKYIEQFLERYSRYIEFREIGNHKEASDNKVNAGNKPIVSEQIISEIRIGSPSLYETRYEFTKEEIIQIQVILYKLGYDPGPPDGTMNSKTMAAIEKFKTENKVLMKLF